ncbi:MAG: conjugative transposon protein TraM [Alistipes sp.]|nr:conjugative transposon protein TraM [Alistipes sp.]
METNNMHENEPVTVTEKQKKVPNEQMKQKLKTLLVGAILFLLFSIFMYMVLKPDTQPEPENTELGINYTVPDAKDGHIESSKTKAQEIIDAMEFRGRNKITSLGDNPFYAIQHEAQDSTVIELPSISLSENVDEFPKDDYLISSHTAYTNNFRQIESFYQQPTIDPHVEDMRRQIEQLTERLTEKQSETVPHYDPLEMMEKSYQMAAQYLNGDINSNPTRLNDEIAETPTVRVVKTGVNTVSTLSVDDTAIRQNQFNTAVGKTENHSNPNAIRVSVEHDQTLTEGSPIKLRLLDEIDAEGVTIPANSPLIATGKVTANRMEIEVSSIHCNDMIIPVSLIAYDSDGQKGIYVPGSNERDAVKDAANSATNSVGSGLTISHSAGQQIAADLVRGGISGTSQYIATRTRQLKINLKAGQQFYLIPSK